jgi:protein-disulfide isomerase
MSGLPWAPARLRRPGLAPRALAILQLRGVLTLRAPTPFPMASRTKQKEEARARRLAEERAHAERAQRERRVRTIGGIVLTAVIVVAVFIAISSGGGSQTGLQTGQKASQVTQQVDQLLAGIPQSGGQLGKPTAPVTLTYYGDLECPVCQAFTLQGGFPQLVSNDIKAGKVKVVYKAFQTATRAPNVFATQQVAALAAGKQNHFWDYTELFYRQQGQEGSGYVTDSYLNGLARQVTGLSLQKWQTARSDPALATQVQSEEQQGRTLGVTGTPTLIFQGPKGTAQPSTSVPTYAELEAAVKKVA